MQQAGHAVRLSGEAPERLQRDGVDSDHLVDGGLDLNEDLRFDLHDDRLLIMQDS